MLGEGDQVCARAQVDTVEVWIEGSKYIRNISIRIEDVNDPGRPESPTEEAEGENRTCRMGTSPQRRRRRRQIEGMGVVAVGVVDAVAVGSEWQIQERTRDKAPNQCPRLDGERDLAVLVPVQSIYRGTKTTACLCRHAK